MSGDAGRPVDTQPVQPRTREGGLGRAHVIATAADEAVPQRAALVENPEATTKAVRAARLKRAEAAQQVPPGQRKERAFRLSDAAHKVEKELQLLELSLENGQATQTQVDTARERAEIAREEADSAVVVYTLGETFKTEGFKTATQVLFGRISDSIEKDPSTEEVEDTREIMTRMATLITGAGAGGASLIGIGHVLGQEFASIAAITDEPLALTAAGTMALISKRKELKNQGETLGGWLKESLQKQIEELKTLEGLKDKSRNAIRPALGTAFIAFLAYVAYKYEGLAEPINAFLGAGVGAFIAAEGRELIRGEEDFQKAFQHWATLRFPEIHTHHATHADSVSAGVATATDRHRRHPGRGGHDRGGNLGAPEPPHSGSGVKIRS